MAIEMMCSENEYKAHPNDSNYYISDVWSKEVDRQMTSQGKKPFLIYMHRTHIGVVLRTGEHNYYDDSDFYAIVWNIEKGQPEEIEYASTRGWTDPNRAIVDATPEIVETYNSYLVERSKMLNAWRAEEEAKRVGKGKVVRVVKGRKVPIGTEGKVFWEQEYTYSYNNTVLKVGIKTSTGETFFTSANNCEVVRTTEESD